MCFKPDRSENLSCHYPLSVAASLSILSCPGFPSVSLSSLVLLRPPGALLISRLFLAALSLCWRQNIAKGEGGLPPSLRACRSQCYTWKEHASRDLTAPRKHPR